MGQNSSAAGDTHEFEAVFPNKEETIEVDDFWRHWKLVRKLGKGRTCEVVEIVSKKYFDGEQKGPYACKILTRGKSAMKKIFERECYNLGLLDSNYCVELIGGVSDPQNHYIITNLCSGGELFYRISNVKKAVTEDECRRIATDMVMAVKHIHERGIIHRDLKPENFMFESAEPNSRLRLIDFGSAVKVVANEKYKELAGTPYYMSPESVRNLDRTEYELRATDVWSIGVITYVTMSRRPPFGGPTNKDIFTKILKYKLKWPKNCNWSPELRDFLKKMIEKDSMKRMTLDEAIQHPFILNTKLTDAYRKDCFVMEDTSEFSIYERQLSRDEPLVSQET